MAKEATERKSDAPDAPPDEESAPRNTLIPSFDVATYAKAVDGTEARPALVTITDEVELEAARVASMKSSLPPPRNRVRSEAEVEIGTAEVDLEGEPEEPAETAPEASGARDLPQPTEKDLEDMVGDLAEVPQRLVKIDHVHELGLDHHSGFMLALIDGTLDYETILDVCGMSRYDALRVLANLVQRKVVGVKR